MVVDSVVGWGESVCVMKSPRYGGFIIINLRVLRGCWFGGCRIAWVRDSVG